MESVMDTHDLDMMLEFPVRVTNIKCERKVGPLPYLERSFTVRLQFQNTTIETDIQEGDPRYQTIRDHLTSVGRMPSETI